MIVLYKNEPIGKYFGDFVVVGVDVCLMVSIMRPH